MASLRLTPVYHRSIDSDCSKEAEAATATVTIMEGLPVGRKQLALCWWRSCPNKCRVHMHAAAGPDKTERRRELRPCRSYCLPLIRQAAYLSKDTLEWNDDEWRLCVSKQCKRPEWVQLQEQQDKGKNEYDLIIGTERQVWMHFRVQVVLKEKNTETTLALLKRPNAQWNLSSSSSSSSSSSDGEDPSNSARPTVEQPSASKRRLFCYRADGDPVHPKRPLKSRSMYALDESSSETSPRGGGTLITPAAKVSAETPSKRMRHSQDERCPPKKRLFHDLRSKESNIEGMDMDKKHPSSASGLADEPDTYLSLPLPDEGSSSSSSSDGNASMQEATQLVAQRRNSPGRRPPRLARDLTVSDWKALSPSEGFRKAMIDLIKTKNRGILQDEANIWLPELLDDATTVVQP